MQKKGYSPHGINLNLRTLKTFLKWCINRDYFTRVPHISMVRTPQVAPSYISDKNFDKIIFEDVIPIGERIRDMIFIKEKNVVLMVLESIPAIGVLKMID